MYYCPTPQYSQDFQSKMPKIFNSNLIFSKITANHHISRNYSKIPSSHQFLLVEGRSGRRGARKLSQVAWPRI